MSSITRKLIVLLLLLGQLGVAEAQQKGPAILCLVYPVYVLAKNLTAGTTCRVDLLLPANLGCPHHYSLTPGDLQKIAEADVLVANGSGFEPFLARIAQEFPAKPIIDCSSGAVILRDPATSIGNPHVFSFPKGLTTMTQNLRQELSRLFPQQAGNVASNASSLVSDLGKMEETWETTAQNVSSTPVFITHDSLDYLARELRLNIIGHTDFDPEDGNEPAAGELLALANLIRREKPKAILVDDQRNDSLATTLSKETGTPIIACHSLSGGPLEFEPTFPLQVLQENNNRLAEGLRK